MRAGDRVLVYFYRIQITGVIGSKRVDVVPIEWVYARVLEVVDPKPTLESRCTVRCDDGRIITARCDPAEKPPEAFRFPVLPVISWEVD